MNKIKKEQLLKLLDTIQPSPMLSIAHFSDGAEIISEVLSDYCLQHEYEYLLNCTDRHFYENAKLQYGMDEWVKIKSFDLDRASYMTHGRFFDYLFVTCGVADEMREHLIQKSHKVIKNAGYIVIFVAKESDSLRETWIELLDMHNFVATSTIDLFEDYNVIISKKMHGWGG